MKQIQKGWIFFISFVLMCTLALPLQAQAVAYDPETLTEGQNTLPLRFWNDERPSTGFYINAANRYILENVTAPSFGTSAGEWSVMDLLRGAYAGYDYLNDLPEGYYEDYLERVEGYVIAKEGALDKNKSTEWSRAALAMSALGYDIRSVGEAGNYVKLKHVMTYRGEEIVDPNNSVNYYATKLDTKDTFTLPTKMGMEFSYTNINGKEATGFAIVPAGTYTLDRENSVLIDANHHVVEVSYVEESYGKEVATHTLTKLALSNVAYTLDKPFDFVEKLSTSYRFSYRQGINGPIWILIALNTGGYDLYTEEQLVARGVKVTAGDINTKGKMIDYILGKEITNTAGRVGGWALSGKAADPDITMMAVQALAPYYLDEQQFKDAYRTTINAETNALWDVESESFTAKYTTFKATVERAVAAMAEDQQPNGGYTSMGTLNVESTTQVVVGLTALQIDPLADSVYLPTIDRTVSFIKEGALVDGVTTNNMIDAILTFWALGSGSSPEIGGFKHVTAGYDGGGGAGTTVNAMATDQATYGLIAYERFLNNKNHLYDMTDMINGQYKTMRPTTYTARYIVDGQMDEAFTYSPYEVITLNKKIHNGDELSWTTNKDGSGAIYKANELLSAPDKEMTLYAHSFTGELPMKEITNPNHTFTVQYNEKIAPASVSNAKVYVRDEQGTIVQTNVSIGEDEQSVFIDVVDAYEVGKTYTIYVEKGIQTADASATLVEPVKMAFTVVAQ